MLTVDAHHHLWDRNQADFDYAWLDAPTHHPIAGSFLPPDLQSHSSEAKISHSVVVQTQHHLRENDWALSMAQRYPSIAGIVGWVDLQSAACSQQIAHLRHLSPKFVGVRHVIQDEADDQFLLRPALRHGFTALQDQHLTFDLLLYPKHLVHVPTVASTYPELRFVLNHLGKPAVQPAAESTAAFAAWRESIDAIAACENVFCKLSGLVTEADWQGWTPAQLRPYLWQAIESFGPPRCMFGSDWPVCLLAATYNQVHQSVMQVVSELSPGEQAAIWGQTANQCYGLHLPHD